MADFNNPPLNVQPQGLLDFLQIKNGGEYPQTLGKVLDPTWDLRQHYYATNSNYTPSFAVPFVTGVNTVLSIIPKASGWRWCESLSLQWVPAAAADALGGVLLLFNAVTLQSEGVWPAQPAVPYGAVSYPGGFNFAASATLTRPQHVFSEFWIPPGLDVGIIQLNGTNGGAAVLNASHRIVNLRS